MSQTVNCKSSLCTWKRQRLVFVVKRYAIPKANIERYAFRKLKIKQYAVRKGDAVSPLFLHMHTYRSFRLLTYRQRTCRDRPINPFPIVLLLIIMTYGIKLHATWCMCNPCNIVRATAWRRTIYDHVRVKIMKNARAQHDSWNRRWILDRWKRRRQLLLLPSINKTLGKRYLGW